MKSKLILSLLALAFLTSCEKEKKTEANSTEITQNKETFLDVQTFSALPELADCSTYIAKSKEDYEAGKFIFADDYGNNAYIKIGNEMKQILLEEETFDPSDTVRQIEIEGGSIRIEIQPIIFEESEESGGEFNGKITIKQNGKTFESSIFGTYTC